MRMPNLAGALVIAMLTAASLHLSVQPASADDGSFCARLEAISINIEAAWRRASPRNWRSPQSSEPRKRRLRAHNRDRQ